ncbi:MAG: hypothetical protein K2Y39_20055 [Candidatus Obscuribacterales bacterium]|nr:hypothetical protein [Candidatus Obscuribacterales bacterium]
MTYYADMSSDSMWWFTGEPLCSIGWLNPAYEYPVDTLSPGVWDVLSVRLSAARRFLCHRGLHECEYCWQNTCSGALLFPSVDLQKLFIAPPMISHYIEAHSYFPPEEFVEAVLSCPQHDSDEYCDLLEDMLEGRPDASNFLEQEMLSRAARIRRNDYLSSLRASGDKWAQ